MVPRAAVINDLSGFGRCSLTAAISVLSAMGVQPVPMPTALLSAQTGYPSYYCDDFTNRMGHFTEEWQKMDVSFQGIYTGFVLGKRQVEEIHRFLESFYGKDTLLLVDPILGDDGMTYPIYSRSLQNSLRELARQADVITPNLTEFCLLTETDYGRFSAPQKEPQRIFEEMAAAGKCLFNKPGKKVVVTGVRCLYPNGGVPMVANVLLSESGTHVAKEVCHPGSYSGTGDLFASVLMGGLLRQDTLEETMELAGRFLEKSIAVAVKERTDRNDGVPYEPFLPMLMPAQK